MSTIVRPLPGVLDQDEVWVHGERLETMDRHHRANLIPFLRRNAEALQRAAEQDYYRSLLFLATDPSDGVADAQHAIEAEFEMPAEDWLERRPLMRRLVELEAGRPIEQRRLTQLRNRIYEIATGYRKVTLR